MMAKFRRDWVENSTVVVSLLALAIALMIVGLRWLGALERLELTAYDWCMALRPSQNTVSRVTLIGIKEEDITAIGQWPLADATLAEALNKIIEGQPLAVGVDLYRNLPVPPGSAELAEVVLANPRLVMIRKYGDQSSPEVPPPSFLSEGGEQTGFSDIVIDSGGVVRRGLLLVGDGQRVFQSLALRLATRYLAAKGVVPRPDPLTPEYMRLGDTTIRPLGPDDGGYVRLDAQGYQFLLDFRDQAAALPIFSLSDLLAGRIAAEALRGRVVLLGAMAASMHDSFFTPARLGGEEEGMVPGVTVHAHAVSQLLRLALDGEPPIRSLPKMAEGVWLVACCLLGGAIALWARAPAWWASLAAAGVMVNLALSVIALGQGLWLPMIPPVLGLLATAGGSAAYLSYEEGKSRRFLMDIFSRHVSPAVAHTLWRQRRQFINNGRPLPQRLTATVMFTDLVAFTSLAEGVEPSELMEWLNQYMEVMGREVMAHGGIINKYIGDSIMALFGAPLARGSEAEIRQDAVNAVQCALSMRLALRELNRRWQEQGRRTAQTRVGIFTGPVVAGSVGSAERLEYTVVGDTVNVASRLESFDKKGYPFHPLDNPCRILIGESTKVLVEAAGGPPQAGGDQPFSLTMKANVRLRGKDRPGSIYEVVGGS